MTPLNPLSLLLPVLGAAALFAATAIAQESGTSGAAGQGTPPAATANTAGAGAEWPCEQPLRPEMSMGAMWSGPDPDAGQTGWRELPEVSALVEQIAPRRTPQEEAAASIRRFAAAYQGTERTEALTKLFAGLFDTLDSERNDIIRGIKRFYRRQDALARRIEEGWKALGEVDPSSADPKVIEQRLALQQQVDWDSRIFDDRQRLLPAVCDLPRVLEQRIFTLSRVIQDQLATDQP